MQFPFPEVDQWTIGQQCAPRFNESLDAELFQRAADVLANQGVGGEQFALADTVTALRKQQKAWQNTQERDPATRKPLRHIINATDPLNLLGTLLPDRKVSHLSGNRILFEDGLPLAVLEKDEVKLLRDHDNATSWELQKLLQKKSFPPRLRAYIGKV